MIVFTFKLFQLLELERSELPNVDMSALFRS